MRTRNRISDSERSTLKAGLVANIGDTIRGYDFKPMVGRNDCFVEGVVECVSNDMGYTAFKITVTRDVFDGQVQPKGKGSRVGKCVYVPFQVSFMEFAGRIMNLSR
jgi:hypothetical protein